MININEFKRFFMFNLIGSLIIAALIAVVVILIGGFNETMARAMFTLLMVVIHSFVCLGFIWNNEKSGTFNRLGFFTDVLFLLVVASFLISIFGVWEIITGETIANLYQAFFVIAFGALHGNILAKALKLEGYLDFVVYLNYLLMVVVIVMLMPIIFLNNAVAQLGDFYFRFLGAAGIIDGTLTILTIIFYKLYMSKHPSTEDTLANDTAKGKTVPKAEKKSGLSLWVWILIIYLIVQVVFPMIFFFSGQLF